MCLRYGSYWQTIALPKGTMVSLPLHEGLYAIKRTIGTTAPWIFFLAVNVTKLEE
jgi:hypothetical protein